MSNKLAKIRYHFFECGCLGSIRRRSIFDIFPNGSVTCIVYEGKKVVKKARYNSTAEKFTKLMEDCIPYEHMICYMDACDDAIVVYDDGSTVKYSPAPSCIGEFVNNLDPDNYVL